MPAAWKRALDAFTLSCQHYLVKKNTVRIITDIIRRCTDSASRAEGWIRMTARLQPPHLPLRHLPLLCSHQIPQAPRSAKRSTQLGAPI